MSKLKNFISKHKKLLIILPIILLLLIAVKKIFFKGEEIPPIARSEVTTLEKKDFETAVTEQGEAVSEDSLKIYCEKPLPVKEINVEVGDKIEKDQVIARLDDTTIRQQIETKQAIIAANNKSTSTQVKNAQDRLNDAKKSLDEGTNANLIAANNAVLAAYDQWQSAERTYDDYERSINLGYNSQILQENTTDKTAKDSVDAAQLNYNQSREKLLSLQGTIGENSSRLNSVNSRIHNLKERESYLNKRINDLTGLIESASSSQTNSSVDLDRLNEELIDIGLKINSVDTSVPGSDSLLNSLRERETQIKKEIDRINSLPQDNSNLGKLEADKRELEALKAELKSLTEDLTLAQTDKAKYEAEIESSQKQIEASNMEIDQQGLVLNKAKSDLGLGEDQKGKTEMSRQDQLEVYRKNANDLKTAYESALRNLDVAQAAAKNEISSLKSNLDIAGASGDNSVNSVDLKHLYEDLEKTVIKAPISGTVTEINMIKGQVPADYLAQVDTVDRIIVKSKVKEFDINNIKIGMDAEVTSSALGSSKVFKAKVESINPTPIQNKAINTQGSGEVYYETKLTIEDENNEIKPGMTLRVKYIFESKKDVFTVPVNAIYEKNGKSFILAHIGEKVNKYTLEEFPVIVKEKNDYEAVITSDTKLQGLNVINMPDKYSAGMEVGPIEESDEAKNE